MNQTWSKNYKDWAIYEKKNFFQYFNCVSVCVCVSVV